MGVLSACSSDDPAAAPVIDAGTEAATPAIDAAPEAATTSTLSYKICPGGYSGACATVDMPLDWSAPDGKKIPILIDKIVSSQHPKRQVWLLQGGPGGSAAGMVPMGLDLGKKMDDVEVLTIEHRGVGALNRLACPIFEAAHPPGLPPLASDAGVDGGDAAAPLDAGTDAATAEPPFEMLGCFEEMKQSYGSDLAFYTTTNAARDLARAIELAGRGPDVPVFVYGVSYGTYWAQRFMQIKPAGVAAGVILDSIVAPGEQFLSTFDTQGDVAAKKVAELCKLDATCNANLGPDPWAKIQTIRQKLDSGWCPESGVRPNARVRLTQLLFARPLTGYAFALLYRYDRCSPGDVAAIKAFASKDPFKDPGATLNSPGVSANVAFSELWELPAPDNATMKQRFDAAVFPFTMYDLSRAYSIWPKYPTDEFVGKYATTAMPILMLAGSLDAQTPIESQEKVKAHFNGPNQTFVSVPTGNHSIINQSPMIPEIGSTVQKNCGMEVLLQFLTNPQAVLDTSCTTKIAPLEFKRPSQEVMFFLGTTDMWIGAPQLSDAPEPSFDFTLLQRIKHSPFGL